MISEAGTVDLAALALVFMVFLAMLLRQFQALVNEINVALRGTYAAGLFFREAVQYARQEDHASPDYT